MTARLRKVQDYIAPRSTGQTARAELDEQQASMGVWSHRLHINESLPKAARLRPRKEYREDWNMISRMVCQKYSKRTRLAREAWVEDKERGNGSYHGAKPDKRRAK